MSTSAAGVRLYESAAEELGRLDALLALAPSAVAEVLRYSAIARLSADPLEATRALCASLVAASVEMVHAAALDPAAAAWADRVDDADRRARSGAPLQLPEQLAIGEREREQVLDALRPGVVARPLLLRALQVAAWLPDTPQAELLAAAVLSAGGLTARIRLLPFADVPADQRTASCAAWREGDAEPWTRAALGVLAAQARQLRLQLQLLLAAMPAEDAHLASIGRAAVTARRALTQLRSTLATSVPVLSEALELSRPAAGAALERLVALGLAEEITGRGRDRVFVYAAAWEMR